MAGSSSWAGWACDKHMEELTKQAKGLEEILHNQAHPDNLVAVKKSGTPVLANPIEGAKVLFLATAEDEFEIRHLFPRWRRAGQAPVFSRSTSSCTVGMKPFL